MVICAEFDSHRLILSGLNFYIKGEVPDSWCKLLMFLRQKMVCFKNKTDYYK